MKKLMIRGERVWREAIERKSDRGEERERWRDGDSEEPGRGRNREVMIGG